MSARFRCLALFVVLAAGVGFAAPPEEEEDPFKPAPKAPGIPPGKADDTKMPPGAKDKDEGNPFEPAAPGSAPPADGADAAAGVTRLPDIAREAVAATHPVFQAFYGQFPVAFDRITIGTRSPYRAVPFPLVWGKDKYPKTFGVAVLDKADAAAEPQEVALRRVKGIEHFEAIVLAEVDKLLALPTAQAPPPIADRLAVAEKTLVATYFYHDTAREQTRRRGKSWDVIKDAVYGKLAAVRVQRLQLAADAKQYDRVTELSAKYAQLYTGRPDVLEQVIAARLAEGVSLAASDRTADLEKARGLLADYESRFPAGKAAAVATIRKLLADRARAMMDDASRVADANKGEARNLLATVEKIDPDNGRVRAMRQELKLGYPVLIVGARSLPVLMSPARARTDAEKQAVELMFEGLMEAVPDDLAGVRFSPVLAAARPVVDGGVRDVRLVGAAGWTQDGTGALTAADVAGTIRLLRLSPTTWAADPAAWLADPGLDPADPSKVRVRFQVGHPDPRTALTLKLLPATWLLSQTKRADDEAFARRPFGTGPFRLGPPNDKPPAANGPLPDVVFVANPAYARRPGLGGRPVIKEVRFTDLAAMPDPATEFKTGRLHVLTDVPTADLAAYAADNNLRGAVKTVTALDPRRVHVMAVNHRRPPLQSVELRRALTHAVDRAKILTEVFRAPLKPDEFHKAMAGPFPPGAWATPKSVGGGDPPALFNKDLAAGKMRDYLAGPGAVGTLSLSYPAGDKQAQAACERIKAMVDGLTAEGDRKFVLRLDPVPAADLVRLVETEQRYDLAYLPIDYPTAWFPLTLSSLLDPAAAVPGGRNVLGYLANGSNPAAEDLKLGQTLAEVRSYRDPAGKLGPLAGKLHQQFNDAVPFVPLWQLDRHTVLAAGVKVRFPGEADEADPRRLDPTTLFTGVGEWRVE